MEMDSLRGNGVSRLTCCVMGDDDCILMLLKSNPFSSRNHTRKNRDQVSQP